MPLLRLPSPFLNDSLKNICQEKSAVGWNASRKDFSERREKHCFSLVTLTVDDCGPVSYSLFRELFQAGFRCCKTTNGRGPEMHSRSIGSGESQKRVEKTHERTYVAFVSGFLVPLSRCTSPVAFLFYVLLFIPLRTLSACLCNASHLPPPPTFFLIYFPFLIIFPSLA